MRLPPGRGVCYKPDMRKWMRDRIMRRKKKDSDPAQTPDKAQTEGDDALQAPLRPAFYESEAAERPGKPAARAASEPEGNSEAAADEVHGESEAQPAGNAVSAQDRSRRRRRGRGGRGRRSGKAGEPAGTASPRPSRSQQAPLQPTFLPPLQVVEPDSQDGETARSAHGARRSKAAAAAPTPPPAASKGVVVLAIGLPGAGKSSWFKRHTITPLSSDLLRSLLFDNADEQRFQDLVFSNLRSMLRARLIAHRPINYVDATNLSPQERQGWIKLAKDYSYEVQAVFFDVPVEVCIERNQRRRRSVPEDVMRRMASKLRPPAFTEGFSKITVVRVKKKE